MFSRRHEYTDSDEYVDNRDDDPDYSPSAAHHSDISSDEDAIPPSPPLIVHPVSVSIPRAAVQLPFSDSTTVASSELYESSEAVAVSSTRFVAKYIKTSTIKST